MARTIFFLIAYDGTEFHGWQQQPGLRTVQGLLTESIQRVVRHEVDLSGSGRTDAGVHAAGQVASFVTSCQLPASRLRYAVGSRLPDDVAVDSFDMLPAMLGIQDESDPIRPHMLTQSFRGQFQIRQGDWK